MKKAIEKSHLHAIRSRLNLSPTHCLVWSSSGITSIEFLCRVDVYGTIGSISHQARIRNMMFNNPTSEDDHACPDGMDGHGVDLTDVFYDVDFQMERGGLVRVEVEHITYTPVCEGGAEDGDVVLIAPVVDAPLVVDLLAQTVDDLAGGPVDGLLGVLGGLLLLEHGGEDGHDPVLKEAVVVIRDDEVADAVQALCAQGGARRGELAEEGGAQAFDEVFLNAAGGGDDGGDVGVLGEVAQGAAEARGDEVAGVAEEDGGLCIGFRVAPGSLGGVLVGEGEITGYWGLFWSNRKRENGGERGMNISNMRGGAYHVVDNPDGLSNGAGLEPHMVHAGHQIIDGNCSAGELVEIKLFDLLGAYRHFVRRHEDSIRHGGWNVIV